MITLIATTYNASEGLIAWCESIKHQTVKPDSVIVVDGGSTDDTPEILRQYGFHVFYLPTFNAKYCKSPVAAGRNRAIYEAKDGIICVTDAGCVLSLGWVEAITAPFVADPTVWVVGGSYRVVNKSRFGQRMAGVFNRDALNRLEFSSRSIAFKRSVWLEVGGYPETSVTAEDTLFNYSIKHYPSAFAPNALVYWNGPKGWKAFARLQYRYAWGDGFNGLRRGSYFRIFAKYLFPPFLVYAFWGKDIALKFVSDVSKSIGYIAGTIEKVKNG
jgi:glycosyltransferase involved in cell wall biosynthesis